MKIRCQTTNGSRLASRIRKRSGLTMVEIVMAIAMVSFLLLASTQAVHSVFVARRENVNLQVGPALARQLMSEILRAPYVEPDDENAGIGNDMGDTGSDRSGFDDVDDYHNWSESSPKRRDGSSLGYGTNWSRQVNVAYVQPDTLNPSLTDTGLKLITVSVLSPDGDVTTLYGLRSRLGRTERQPSADRTFVSGCLVELQINNSTSDIVSGAGVKNHVAN